MPITGADWETAKSFAQTVALAMTADDPKRYVAKITKSLRTGKIFVDYLRNSLEQTAVAAYRPAREQARLFLVPVTWEELGRTKAAINTPCSIWVKRLGSLKQDPWKDIWRAKKRKLPDPSTLRKS